MPIKAMAPYWYLYVLVFYYILFFLLEDKKYSEKMRLLVFAAVSTLGSVIAYFTNLEGYLCLVYFFKYVVFFAIGMHLSKKNEPIQRKEKIVLYIGTVACFAAVLLFHINMLSVPVIGVVLAGCTVLSAMSLFSDSILPGNRKVMNLCGRYSLEIYVTHCFITAANRSVLVKLGVTNFGWNVFVNFLMATFLPVLCAYVLKKMGLHKMVFRPFSVIAEKHNKEIQDG